MMARAPKGSVANPIQRVSSQVVRRGDIMPVGARPNITSYSIDAGGKAIGIDSHTGKAIDLTSRAGGKLMLPGSNMTAKEMIAKVAVDQKVYDKTYGAKAFAAVAKKRGDSSRVKSYTPSVGTLAGRVKTVDARGRETAALPVAVSRYAGAGARPILRGGAAMPVLKYAPEGLGSDLPGLATSYSSWVASVKSNGGTPSVMPSGSLKGQAAGKYYFKTDPVKTRGLPGWAERVNARQWPAPDAYDSTGQYGYYIAPKAAREAREDSFTNTDDAPRKSFADSLNEIGDSLGDSAKWIGLGLLGVGVLAALGRR